MIYFNLIWFSSADFFFFRMLFYLYNLVNYKPDRLGVYKLHLTYIWAATLSVHACFLLSIVELSVVMLFFFLKDASAHQGYVVQGSAVWLQIIFKGFNSSVSLTFHALLFFLKKHEHERDKSYLNKLLHMLLYIHILNYCIYSFRWFN